MTTPHDPQAAALPVEDALPGLDHRTPPAKRAGGYLAHLAGLDYGDGWEFWSLATSCPELERERRQHPAAAVDAVLITRGGRVRRALVDLLTGAQLAVVEVA